VDSFPRSFWLLEAVLSLTLMGLIRLAPRLLSEATADHSQSGVRAILYGPATPAH
jgi:hypothetical protein